MTKITILGIFLVFGLMAFAVAIPESYAQTTKVKCKSTTYDGTNFKIFRYTDFSDDPKDPWKGISKVLDQCAKEKYQIGYGIGMFYVWKN